MSTIMRTLRNLRKVGIRLERTNSFRYHTWTDGDTKAGTFIAQDRYGNKYFENLEDELPLRTRWVDYKDKEFDPSHIEPGWHAWISYMVDKPPTEDPILRTGVRPWELPDHRPNMTASRSAFKTYSTVKPKIEAWTPQTAERTG
ncbi:hypothetical protein ACMFMF_002908 [Clarireedia jacksonii]